MRCLEIHESEVVMIHTGLSVKVAGCIISIDRGEGSQVAKVMVDFQGQTSLTLPEIEAVKFQAELLRTRAQRFFGAGWIVEGWDGVVPVVALKGAG